MQEERKPKMKSQIAKKGIMLLLTFTMLFSTCVCASASTSITQTTPDIIPCPELGVNYEQSVENGRTTILIKDMEGVLQDTLTSENGNIYLNGEFLCTSSEADLIVESILSQPSTLSYSEVQPFAASSISWGKWQTCEPITIKTGGKTAAVLYGIIALKVGWCAPGVIAVVAGIVASGYDTLKVKSKIRYGTDATYLHYERKTWFYGDGKLIYGPTVDKGKKPLK